MADPINIKATGIDISRWKKLTAQEILKEESRGEDIPAEIVTWAQQMAAFAKIPDNVTYEQVDGDVGLDALDKLGIPEEDAINGDDTGKAVTSDDTEDPDAVKDPARAAELGEEPTEDENIFANVATGVTITTENEKQEDQLTLADEALTTDPEEIRKRKERKGLA